MQFPTSPIPFADSQQKHWLAANNKSHQNDRKIEMNPPHPRSPEIWRLVVALDLPSQCKFEEPNLF